MGEYNRARQNLEKLGLRPDEITSALDCSRFLITMALRGDRIGVEEAASFLRDFYQRTGLEINLNNRNIVPFDSGLEYIFDSVARGEIVGVTGKPGVGKTTLLTYLPQHCLVIDEFWTQEEGYSAKARALKKVAHNGQAAVVLACQLESDLITRRVHLVNPIHRNHNLQTRRRNLTDRLRTEYFEAFDINDTLLYETERVHADKSIDTSRIRY